MRLGFVVNDIATEAPRYTTTLLSRAALAAGHDVWVMGVADLCTAADGGVQAMARTLGPGDHGDGNEYLEALRSEEAEHRRIDIGDLDVLWLRSDPAADMDHRPWAASSTVLFGQLATRTGVTVLNDPFSLANALNKTYFEQFPEDVRPRTLITRDPATIKEFIAAEKGNAVIKPLQGSGGRNVFLVREGAQENVNQMIEAVMRDGYAVVQEYLPEAVEGDTRLFLMNGVPLQVDGSYAAIQRVNDTGDARSNMHVGGKSRLAEIDDRVLEIADVIRPKLVDDGMFFVGIDVVGGKLMEVNVFSPGGLASAEDLTGADFCTEIISALQHKVAYRGRYGGEMTNARYATL
jgi:glutathione synthase